MELSNKFFCASLNYQRLDQKSLNNLKSANLKNDQSSLLNFKNNLGFKIDSLAIIDKCNAIILLIVYQEDLSLDYLKGHILSTWDRDSFSGISDFIKDIKFYSNEDALKFLAECATGVHSVTVGDSQVSSQVTEGLLGGIHGESGSLRLISNWISQIVDECRIKTEIFKGNTSLERIASEVIVRDTPIGKSILLVGYGKSGKLVAKILNRENNIPLHILNRTLVNIAEEKLNSLTVNCTSFSDFRFPMDIAGVAVALDNNEETNTIIVDLLKAIKKTDDIFFVDLSTPSLLVGKVDNYIGIEKLSEIAQNNMGTRKNEISKVRNIINGKIYLLIDQINQSIAQLHINKQRQDNLKLSQDKVDLVKYRSKMYQAIRSFLDKEKFVEVTTPYIVGISTDPPKVDKGGAINVEWINGTKAFLRQSNQIYKQILVASGLPKVYEVGPFWRKEENESYRHLQESTGLDVELKDPGNLKNIYLLACRLIKISNDCIINNFRLTNYLSIPKEKNIPVLTYEQSVKLLQEHGNIVVMGDDLGLVNESKLGLLIKKNYDSDIFVIIDYPDTIKKFYTKDKPGGLTETFDIIVGGWELVSGAIRQTNGELIKKSMLLSGINTKDYDFYISIVDKAVNHGGFCIGLDRLLAKILNKETIADAVAFPRTYKKLIP